ncbi:amino acid adenylation domain-containing protein [Candidatus Poribacteria bacterium]|nr:amino acid adenylation domain-containing protein [Candidatus Poribacteria bacterium]
MKNKYGGMILAKSPAVKGKNIHPTNDFIRFEREELGKSIIDRFERQVEEYKDKLSVNSKYGFLTYAELNTAANNLAHVILERCGENSEPVGLMIQHDVPLIPAIFGILKARKFYVPLDPDLPHKRVEYILKDTSPELIVTNDHNLPLIRKLGIEDSQIININKLSPELPSHNPNISIFPEDYAYIMYTSGSTGQPKGVIENHMDVMHFAMIFINNFHIHKDDRLTLLSSSSFSASVADIFTALLSGASLHVFDIKKETLHNMAQWLIDEEITAYGSVPALLRHFAGVLTVNHKFPKMRLLKVGGDRMYKTDVDLFKKHFPDDCILVNGLGAAEAKIIRQYFIHKYTEINTSIVPVGYEVDGCEVMLLDDKGKSVKFGEAGEIVIKSKYISPGYWGKPELTKKKFLPDPDGSDKRIYHTGDLGVMEPDTLLTHLGRKDFQIKIRGYRIESAEVENTMMQMESIREAVVKTAPYKSGEQRLVAYYIPEVGYSPTVSLLRKELAEKLPDYMIPSTFVKMKIMPLNTNNKVDRQALPEPDTARPELDNPYVPPKTPVEEKLTEIWEEILNLDQVGINDNFLELGGHSLLATQIISRLHDAFNVEIPQNQIFQSPTIAEMSVAISGQKAEQGDKEDIERILNQLESISDEEALDKFEEL